MEGMGGPKFNNEVRERCYAQAVASVKGGMSIRQASEAHSIPGQIRIHRSELSRRCKPLRCIKPAPTRAHVDLVGVRDINDANLLLDRGVSPAQVARQFGIDSHELQLWVKRRTAITLGQGGVGYVTISRRLGVPWRQVVRWFDLHGVSTRTCPRVRVEDEDYGRSAGNDSMYGRIWAYVRAGYRDDQIHRSVHPVTKRRYSLDAIRSARYSYEVVHAVWAGAGRPELLAIGRRIDPKASANAIQKEVYWHLKRYKLLPIVRERSGTHGKGPVYDDGYTSPTEMAERCGVDHRHILKAMHAGKIPVFPLVRGKRVYYRIPKGLTWPLQETPDEA